MESVLLTDKNGARSHDERSLHFGIYSYFMPNNSELALKG
jgi:hypothetical protein